MKALFSDRREAGKTLAKKLSALADGDDVVVLALPRGGVPVGFEVAKHLNAPLDLMLVRKLGMPGQEELAMGALALPDVRVFNHDVIRNFGVSEETIDGIIAAERKELLRRNKVYRGDEPPPEIENRIVILVDDGMATGADMRAAVGAVDAQKPSRIVVAVPVGSREACESLKRLADVVVCLHAPELFFGVGQAYESFAQTGDDEVLSLLEESKRRRIPHGPAIPKLESKNSSA